MDKHDKETNKSNIVMQYLSMHVKSIIYFLASIFILALILYLINVSTVNIGYIVILWGFIGLMFAGYDYYYFVKRIMKLRINDISDNGNAIEEEYKRIINELIESKNQMQTENEQKRKDMIDYYTLWVHQIKTPMAGLNLLIQTEKQKENVNYEFVNDVESELFKIEQYAEMVLSYLRMNSDFTDYVIKQYNIGDIVRPSIRKFAKLFIRKRLAIDVHDIDEKVLTDEKWTSFVIEQILSNAVKYTNSGKVSIYMEKEKVLLIEDTGIGISADNIKRVFENGYTGYNGRMDKRATGIGLYLCKLILNRLGHDISISSEVGKGTKVMISFNTIELEVE